MSKLESPEVTVLRSYCQHRRFFYLNYMEKFKLFASWYLGFDCINDTFTGPPLMWYRDNYELRELAKILVLTEQDVLGILEEIHDDY